jgi:chemotaxis protein MotB
MQRMEALEDTPASHHQTLSGSIRWMVPYADLVTILLGLFLVLYALQSKDLAQHKQSPLPAPSAQSELNREQNALIEDQQRHIALLEEELTGSKTEVELTPMNSEPTQGLNFLMDNDPSKNDTDKNTDLAQLAQLKQEKLNPNISITKEERGVVISLKDNILFSPGEARLSTTAKKTLDQLALSLKPLTQPIRVEGHSDNTPIRTAVYPSNWELSTARATEIVKYLVNRHKMSALRLSAAGYGEFKPVADNSTIEGKQKNRRVDIVILDGSLASFEPKGPLQKPNPINPIHQTSRIERKTTHSAEPSASQSLASVQRQVSSTMEKPLEVEREKSWHDPQSQKI